MADTEARNARKVRTGKVVSIAGAKTISVEVVSYKRHPKYGKMYPASKKFHAHDEEGVAGIGDTVRIMETRPISKTKRWRLVEIVEKAK